MGEEFFDPFAELYSQFDDFSADELYCDFEDGEAVPGLPDFVLDEDGCRSSVYEVLEKYFGYRSFRPMQEDIILHAAMGGSAFVLMPTGGGKSLCYQIPSIVRPGMGLVVSPLIALMQDQVDALNRNGIRAAFLNSSLTAQESRRVCAQIYRGRLDILYVSPERAIMDGFISMLHNCRLSMIAVDEAHCVSQWGHDFRPEYTQLIKLKHEFPDVPWMALTATADEATRKDIAVHLELEKERLFITSFDRPNITYHVYPQACTLAETRASFLRFLKKNHEGDAGIVYCMTRKDTEKTAEWLRECGYNALPYHAGLSDEERACNQKQFIQEEGIIIAATVAFGMGIDKPNVRFVAHFSLPSSIEAYYQETGRAGRDGLPSSAWMAYSMKDIVMRQSFIDDSGADELQKSIERRKLKALLAYCESVSCRRESLLEYFGEHSHPKCGSCDNCLNPPKSADGLIWAQKALSCVYRTGQVFGANYIIDVLRGSRSERILNNGHDRLSTYGIGRDLSAKQWSSVFRQLTAAGYLKAELGEKYSTIKLNKKSWEILRGNAEFRVRLEDAPRQSVPKVRVVSRPSEGASKNIAESSKNVELFGILRQKRLELARKEGVPPYCILKDTSLLEIAGMRPKTLEDLKNISGFGVVKIKKYGKIFLDAVGSFLA